MTKVETNDYGNEKELIEENRHTWRILSMGPAFSQHCNIADKQFSLGGKMERYIIIVIDEFLIQNEIGESIVITSTILYDIFLYWNSIKLILMNI